MKSLPLLSIVTPCYNEEDNVEELYRQIKAVIASISNYQFEIIFIDNHSEDRTVAKLKALAATDATVKIIVNTRNFGHIRSPYYGILQSNGLATIYLASDLQDPPELISVFIKAWEEGGKVVMATNQAIDKSSCLRKYFRSKYYHIMDVLTDIELPRNVNGFGLYDKSVVECLRQINDPYPFLRGLISGLGFEVQLIPFNQTMRIKGISKTNFYSLFDIALLGIISHSNIPIRIASFLGILIGTISMLVGVLYFILKLFFWTSFPIGIAPIVIVTFFMFGLVLFFIGLIGEYVASIHTYVKNRPIVVEKERINF